MTAFAAWSSSSVMLELSCVTGAPLVSVSSSTGVGLPDALLAAIAVGRQDVPNEPSGCNATFYLECFQSRE